MLEVQMQMRTPAEEREQEHNNTEYKKKLQKINDSGYVLDFGGMKKTYVEMFSFIQEEKPIEKKVIPPEIQAKLLAGIELTQEEITWLQHP